MSQTPEELRLAAAGGTFCIVPYNHPDYAWTHHREWHAERYAVSTAEALDLMVQYPEFRFCMEPWLDHVEPFLERCPERIDELKARLNNRQMGVKAFTLASPRPATCWDETFIRNMTLGRKKYLEFAPDSDLTVMACPDVGIGHSQMPQVCKLAGAGMYRGWRSDSAFSALGVPRDFLWRGLDGTQLPTSRGVYGALVSADQVPADFSERWDEVLNALFYSDFGQSMQCSQTRTWWVSQGMDDARPLRAWPRDQMMPFVDFIKTWNEREDSKIMFATPNEYRQQLENENLPLWDGVIDQVDVAYNSGWHGEKGLWRLRLELDVAVTIAERACALATLKGVDSKSEQLESLWVEVCRMSSHALQWVFERDWQWITSRARYALRELQELTQQAVTSVASVGRAFGAPRPLVLFNPLAVEREEIIEVPWVQPRQDAGGHVVLDMDGNQVPLQLGAEVGENWGNMTVEAPLIFKAKAPPMGCAVYRVVDGPLEEKPAAPEADVVDNGALTLKLGPRGLQQVIDNTSGLQWNAPFGSSIADCQLFEMSEGILHVGPFTGSMSASKGTGSWICCGPLRWVYRWEAEFHGHRIRQNIILDSGCRHFDLITKVFCDGANGQFMLCLDMPFTGEMTVDIPFGVEQRDLTNEVYAVGKTVTTDSIERHRENQFWARSWASISDGGKGVSVISIDGDKYWTWDAETGKLRHILFTPLDDDDKDWEQWVTKERMALGWHTFHHRIVLHEGDWKSAGIARMGDCARLPLQVVKPLGQGQIDITDDAAIQAQVAPSLSITPDTVRISAFYEETGQFVLRVFESVGEETAVEIQLPKVFSKAVRTDFNLTEIVADCSLDGDFLKMNLKPWEIATVVLTDKI